MSLYKECLHGEGFILDDVCGVGNQADRHHHHRHGCHSWNFVMRPCRDQTDDRHWLRQLDMGDGDQDDDHHGYDGDDDHADDDHHHVVDDDDESGDDIDDNTLSLDVRAYWEDHDSNHTGILSTNVNPDQ